MADGLVAAIVGGWVALMIVLAVVFDDTDPPEFDCARDEVGVWTDYDDKEMACVDATDHGAHQGDHDG